jgi:hypothetical protein
VVSVSTENGREQATLGLSQEIPGSLVGRFIVEREKSCPGSSKEE